MALQFSSGTSDSSANKSSEGGFSFGASTSDTKKSESSSGGFGFSFGVGDTAKTGGGFSFGSSGATTGSTGSGLGAGDSTKKTDSTTTPGLNFSFGDSTTGTSFGAKTDTSTKSSGNGQAKAGFSFGGESANTSQTEGGTSTGSSGFSFGGGDPVKTQSETKQSTNNESNGGLNISTKGILKSSTKKKEDVKPSVNFKEQAQSKTRSDTVEMIIKRWNNELSEDVTDFKKYADQVSKWDREILDNEERIARLMKSVDLVETNQSDLDAQLEAIDEKQKTLNSTLHNLEEEVMTYYTDTKLQPVPDEERYNTYNLAENISKQLEEMSQHLKDMISKLNSSYNIENDENTDTNNIVQILNNHFNALQWIDHKSATLHQQIQKAESELKRLQLS